MPGAKLKKPYRAGKTFHVQNATTTNQSSRPTGNRPRLWPGGKRYFYWDDLPGRRVITPKLSRDEAIKQSIPLARAEWERIRNRPSH
jgi:hypothetical protein